MATALKGVPDEPYQKPEGITSIKIDPLTGTRAEADDSGIYEYFYDEFPPPELEQTFDFEPIPGFPEAVIPGMQPPARATPPVMPRPPQQGQQPAKPESFTPIPGHSPEAQPKEEQLF